jgi:hypothetical protein
MMMMMRGEEKCKVNHVFKIIALDNGSYVFFASIGNAVNDNVVC